MPTASAPPPAVHSNAVHSKLRSLLSRALPVFSFASGAASALFMDRGPKRAAAVAAGTVAAWLSLVVLHGLMRFELKEGQGRLPRLLLWLARFSGMTLTQGMIQLGLFFCAPFYFHAAIVGVAQVDPWHTAFLAGLLLASALTLWDPLTEWLLRKPLLAPLLPAVTSFATLNCVLPGLGLSTQRSLWIAAAAAALAPPLMIGALAPAGRRWRRALLALLTGLALMAALRLGATRLIPAAPLRLVRAEIGTQLDGKWIRDPGERLASTPERLICATAIASPVGLKDRLFHVWRKDGRELWRIELELTGGRAEGYRTRSTLRHFPTPARGRYECSVVTAAGQLLGTRALVIER
jgi:hypothetical protein